MENSLASLKSDYVLVARSEFKAGEKLALRFRGHRRVVKAINNHGYQVEDLRNGERNDIHTSALKFYRDDAINEISVMAHILSSETGMVVARLLRLN